MPTWSRGFFKWLVFGEATLEDFADRLNHVWTFGLLLLLGAVISWKHGSDPVSCWCPTEMSSEQVRHINAACWNSYYIGYPDDLEEYHRSRGEAMRYPRDPNMLPWVSSEFEPEFKSQQAIETTKTTYYQWIPAILCLQALLFKLPAILMYLLHGISGITFGRIASLTEGFQNLNLAERETIAKQIARYLYKWCKNAVPRGLPWRGLTVVWLFVKILYVVNVVCQMTFVDHFLRTRNPPLDNSTSYGDVIVDNFVDNNATTWRNSPVFPGNVLCDVSIRQLRNIAKYTVPCHITANHFNEQAYIFIWMWLLFVFIVTCISLVIWILKTVLPFFRQRYIRRLLSLSDEADGPAPQTLDVQRFTQLVGQDGVMVLKLVGANSSELITKSVVCYMWKFVCTELWGRVPMLEQQPPVQPQQPPAWSAMHPPTAPVPGLPTGPESKAGQFQA